jgi:signal transduction histidine kinase
LSRLRTLRSRLGVVYVVIAAALLVIVYAVAGATIESALVDSAAERLEIEAGLVVADAPGGRQPTATDLAASDLAAVLGGYGTAVVILDGQGNILASESNGADESVLTARLDGSDYAAVIASGQTIHAVRPVIDDRRTLVVAAPVQLRTTGVGNGQGQGQGRGLGNQKPGKGPPVIAAGPANAVAQLAISLDSVDATVASVRWTVQIAALVLLILAGVAVWLVTRFGLQPLEHIAAAADRIAAGDLDARAALSRGADDEVGRLGRAFDGMAERVDSTLRAQRAFAADASHELRSPLTVLSGYIDVLARGEAEPQTRARTLTAMRREVDRLSRLSSDLLLLTQLEAGGGRLDPRPIDITELVEGIGEAARLISRDQEVVVDIAGSLPVIADPDRLTQAVMNLVDNAGRHAPAGGMVRISATRSNGRALVSVANEGSPIPAEDLPRIFDRFFRSGRGPDQDNGHHAGLGLAIVKAIVDASGGTISATSDEMETRISISLPLRPDAGT